MSLVAAILALAATAQIAPPPPSPDSRTIVAEHHLALAETPAGFSGPGWDRLVGEAGRVIRDVRPATPTEPLPAGAAR